MAEPERSIKLVRCVNSLSFKDTDVECRRLENEYLDTISMEHGQRAGVSVIVVLSPGWTVTLIQHIVPVPLILLSSCIL